jgi:hypothetical protein
VWRNNDGYYYFCPSGTIQVVQKNGETHNVTGPTAVFPHLLRVRVNYVQVQLVPDVAARSTIYGEYSETNGVKQEVMNANIEVFPAVFERGNYFIPTEDAEPWARNPEDAIKMVLLHELGHLEAYIRANCRLTKFTPMGALGGSSQADEDAADVFATSAVRCQSD